MQPSVSAFNPSLHLRSHQQAPPTRAILSTHSTSASFTYPARAASHPPSAPQSRQAQTHPQSCWASHPRARTTPYLYVIADDSLFVIEAEN
ncbi:hypothetical protein BDW02DRAFT_245455 [Decorospora gaudefroyi]|uniref:Uncharacterized protein n=1 Tax=Decorospora gaudefroyi TaxID=184978 RepID=A0A6A5KGM4_9PLEO|nr:hypothetical protein BDW02DRAFT_245455 [Decorospora gaudefroyi]